MKTADFIGTMGLFSCAFRMYYGYRVYPTGQILSAKSRRFLKESTSGAYKKYNLCINGKSFNINTHRLLAELYIPNPENKEQVNHIDGNKHNNLLENLEWVTRSENGKHSFKNGLQKVTRPTKKVIDLDGTIYESAKEAASKLGYNHKTLCNMLNHKFNHTNKTTLRYV
jgi:hypothetical protein